MNDQGRAMFREVGQISEIEERRKALVFEIDESNFVQGFAVKFHGKI